MKWAAILLAALPAVASASVVPPQPVVGAIPAVVFQKAKASSAVPEPGDDEADPAKLADRIAKNGKQATDRLAMNDPGQATQKYQNDILKDLDKLLNQPPPPPMDSEGGGGGGSPPPPMGGEQPMGGQQPKGGGQPKGGQQPKGGGEPKGGPESKGGQQPKGGGQPMGGQPMPMGPSGQPMPMGPQSGNQQAGGAQPGLAGATRPTAPPPLALDDRVTKDVWGHLPPQLRQKMNQYYQEQFMPRYADLLKQYYAELAEREKERKK